MYQLRFDALYWAESTNRCMQIIQSRNYLDGFLPYRDLVEAHNSQRLLTLIRGAQLIYSGENALDPDFTLITTRQLCISTIWHGNEISVILRATARMLTPTCLPWESKQTTTRASENVFDHEQPYILPDHVDEGSQPQTGITQIIDSIDKDLPFGLVNSTCFVS